MAIQQYDIRQADGTFEERSWSPRNTPILGPRRRGHPHHPLGRGRHRPAAADRGAARGGAGGARLELMEAAARARLHTAEARLRRVLEQAPVGMAVLRGPTHVFEIANQRYSELVGGRPLTGRAMREAFPELAGQGIYEMLDQTLASGTPSYCLRAPGPPGPRRAGRRRGADLQLDLRAAAERRRHDGGRRGGRDRRDRPGAGAGERRPPGLGARRGATPAPDRAGAVAHRPRHRGRALGPDPLHERQGPRDPGPRLPLGGGGALQRGLARFPSRRPPHRRRGMAARPRGPARRDRHRRDRCASPIARATGWRSAATPRRCAMRRVRSPAACCCSAT